MSEIRRCVELPCAPDALWDALTRDDALSTWLEENVAIDPWPGGAVSTADRDGWVVDVDPGRLLVIRWWRVGDDDTSTVEFEIEATPGGSRLTVVERRDADPGEVAVPDRPARIPFGFQPPKAMAGSRR